MLIPTQLAAAVTGALLSACVFLTGPEPAWARPIMTPGDAAATTAPPVSPLEPQQAAPPPRGHAYLFRGALGPIFSRGMDSLTDQLEHAGIKADVYEFTICRLIAAQAIIDYHRDPVPIVLIGHSMGGLCALTFADILREEDIPVSLVVTIDPAHASPKVPINVERYINVFLSNSVLGGGDVVAMQGYQGHYASFDLSKHEEVTHINIDKMESIHQQLVDAIVQLAATPARAEGEAVPLRYVVPPGKPIELWDSGTAMTARAGDTLLKLAELHHVPVWSLTQINRMAENAPLTAGQRVIIPRHLLPAVTAPAKWPPLR